MKTKDLLSLIVNLFSLTAQATYLYHLPPSVLAFSAPCTFPSSGSAKRPCEAVICLQLPYLILHLTEPPPARQNMTSWLLEDSGYRFLLHNWTLDLILKSQFFPDIVTAHSWYHPFKKYGSFLLQILLETNHNSIFNLDSILKIRDIKYFANKGPSSQSYGFSSSHVWMWELDYKES